jgi:hypothetical protein
MVLKSEFAGGALPQDAPEFWRNSNLCQLKVKDEAGPSLNLTSLRICRTP